MHLDRTELQLLVFAARRTAYAARAEAERLNRPAVAARELEALAARLQDELVVRAAATPFAAGAPAEGTAPSAVVESSPAAAAE